MLLSLVLAAFVSLGHAQRTPPVGAALAPPSRPPTEPAQALARTLFQAIVKDDPALAEAFFFPRDAFVQVKAMARPERYYDKLKQRFVADIHALHARTPDLAQARFDRLEFTRRGGFVARGEEGNKLPYWAARHAWLHYRVGSQARGASADHVARPLVRHPPQ